MKLFYCSLFPNCNESTHSHSIITRRKLKYHSPVTVDTALSKLLTVTRSTEELSRRWPLSISLTKNIRVSLSRTSLWQIRGSPNPSTIIVLSAKFELPFTTRFTFTTPRYVSDRDRYSFSTVPVNTMSAFWWSFSRHASDLRYLAEPDPASTARTSRTL